MKKILLLGGSRYLLPVIKAVHDLGYYAITCDYLPDNIAHQYSDEYHNVSIIDKEAVLELAKKLQVDGIMSFACDPGVETMAYVCEKLGLPCVGSYEAVLTLQNKAKFRAFLAKHGFNVPLAKGYTSVEEAKKELCKFQWPVIVKPVDSAGSKGVTRIDSPEQFEPAAQHAINFSKTESFIVEEFIEQKGYSSDSDCFSVDGKMVMVSFSNQHFDRNAVNPYTPAAFSWPSEMPEQAQLELKSELQRLVTLLDLKTSIYNIETRQGVNGKAYIMEVSPRGGGNRLAEMLRYSTGEDLILNAVKAAVGEKIAFSKPDFEYKGCWLEIILHADTDGIFEDVWIDPDYQNLLFEKDLWVNKKDEVHAFTGANQTIGTLVFCGEQDKIDYMLKHVDQVVKVKVV